MNIHGIVTFDNNFATNAEKYISENYFNGADNALNYVKYYLHDDTLLFEFELKPC